MDVSSTRRSQPGPEERQKLTDPARFAVEARGLTIALGGRTILRETAFAIRQGEFIGVLGSNGAGKTTLMRAMLGLVPIRSGTLDVLGRAPVRGNAAIGYIPQTRALPPGLGFSGWDFVASAVNGHKWGLPRLDTADRAHVEWALDVVGAADLARRPLATLSGGQRQRLLLSQALLGKPKLLLLDEPLISLDPRHQHEIVALVRRVQKELDIAVLFSAHELNPLLPVMDRVLYLGNTQAVLGPVDSVITGPVLSRLYDTDIEVIRLGSRIFVMAGDVEVERDAHQHDGDGGHGHDHASAHAHDDRHSHA